MKRITLVLVAILLICSVGAWADSGVITFKGNANLSPNRDTDELFAGLCISNPPAGLSSLSCASANYQTLGVSIEGSSVTISVSGTTIAASPDPLVQGPVVQAYFTNPPDFQTDYLTDATGYNMLWGLAVNGAINVSSIDPSFLTDMGFSTTQTNWTGTVNSAWTGVDGGGGSTSIVLTDPATDPTPESGTVILVALGLAALTIGCGWQARVKHPGSTRRTASM